MTPNRQVRIAGAKLAFAHRWANALGPSLGGYVILFSPNNDSPVRLDLLYVARDGDLPELKDEQLTLVRSLAATSDAICDRSNLSVSCAPTTLEGHQSFLGWLPDLGFRFLAIIPDTLPTNFKHVRNLAEAHLAGVHAFEETLNVNLQNRALVQQVTQDFEELTWLRGVSQQMGKADIQTHMLDVVTSQLPLLRKVIKSELIALIPIDIISDPDSADLDRITSVGVPPSDWKCILKFVHRCLERGSGPTLVYNIQSVTNLFEPFPEIRNCIVARLEKQGRKYGCLVAINREMEFFGDSPEAFVNIDPNGIQFGTFEAGLITALATGLSSHATNGELFREQENLLTGVVRAVINAIDAKDNYTCGHSDRVAAYAKAIARRMALEELECDRIYLSGLLHDVGKIGVPDHILSKPGKLTDEEFALVKKHPEIGYQILKHLAPLADVLPGVLHHHEAVNGSGYPKGLAGEAIPLQGRILAVADAYDAMTSDRPYRQGMPSEKAEAILRQSAGTIWDEIAVGAILECIECGEVKPQVQTSHAISIPFQQQHPLVNFAVPISS